MRGEDAGSIPRTRRWSRGPTVTTGADGRLDRSRGRRRRRRGRARARRRGGDPARWRRHRRVDRRARLGRPTAREARGREGGVDVAGWRTRRSNGGLTSCRSNGERMGARGARKRRKRHVASSRARGGARARKNASRARSGVRGRRGTACVSVNGRGGILLLALLARSGVFRRPPGRRRINTRVLAQHPAPCSVRRAHAMEVHAESASLLRPEDAPRARLGRHALVATVFAAFALVRARPPTASRSSFPGSERCPLVSSRAQTPSVPS